MAHTVVFDESHGETWTIEPLIAFANSADKPEYYSYGHLAEVLRSALGYTVRRNTSAPLSEALLTGADVLVIAHPASPSVHRGVGGEPIFTPDEIASIGTRVSDGGALLVISEYRTSLWGSNINEVLATSGLQLADDVASAILEISAGTYTTTGFSAWPIGQHPTTMGVERISIHAGCSITVSPDSRATPLATGPDGTTIVAAASQLGQGRIVAVGDSDLFALPYVLQHDNLRFFLNVVEWLATGRVPPARDLAGLNLVPTRRPRIFLSYARADHAAVKSLYEALRTLGYEVWLDTESLVAGQRFETEIYSAIRQSDFFLPCFSKNSINRRGFLQRELKLGLEIAQNFLDEDVYIIPIRLDECSPPQRFSGLQWVDLFHEDGLNRLVSALSLGITQRLTAL